MFLGYSIEGVRILVVEDNALNQRIVKLMLGKLGAVIAGALNGQEAIDLLKENKFDVVLMDLNMPVMDGYETTVYIRKVLQSDIPIIALTADSMVENDAEAFAAGMNAGISKPFDPDHICKLIRTLIDK